MTDDSSHDGVAFADRLLALLDEGSYATTYKYALLLALIDCCLEHSDALGRPPATLTTRALAERVVAIYWPHTAPFPGDEQARVLRQSGTGQAEIVTLIRKFRSSGHVPTGATIAEAKSLAADRYQRLVDSVEWKLVEMPLPRLQRIGETNQPFLYSIDWDTSVRRAQHFGADERPVVRLQPGAGEGLVRLAGLIRPLVQRLWAARVARYNRDVISDSGLEEFLFASQRLAAVRLRVQLTEIQDGRCFYTGEALGRAGEVDHFLPWARFPNNAVENLVVASRRANSDRRAFLVAPDHLRRWRQRNEACGGDLIAVARAARWETRPTETANVARAVYLRLPDGVALWVGGAEFVPSVHADIASALGG